MIIIHNHNVKRISQKLYDYLIQHLDLHQLACPSCGHSGFIVHGYYDRMVRTSAGTFKLLVLRVRCPVCGKTHAVLPDTIVPYSSISMEDTIKIILAVTPEQRKSLFWGTSYIDYSDIHRIQRNFKLYWKERLNTFRIEILPGISERCIQLFHRQFMQIRCTLCGPFTLDHIG